MKKLITSILTLLVTIGCLAGCNMFNPTNSSVVSYDADSAKELLLSTVRQDGNGNVREDYTVPKQFVFDGNTYTVVWSVDVTEGVVVNPGADTDMVATIDVDENATAEIPYTLTFVVTAPDGTTATGTLNRKVKAAPTTVPQAITSAPVEGTAYKLYMYQVTNKGESYFTGKMSGYYYATASNFEDAIDLFVEKVEGKDAFYMYFNDGANKQYLGVSNAWSNGKWRHNNIFATSMTTPNGAFTSTFEWVWNDEYDTMLATYTAKTGEVEVTEETKETTLYLGTYSTYWTFSASEFSHITDADACIGQLVTLVDKSNVPAEDKVAAAKVALEVQTSFNGDATVTLPVKDTTYPEVAITWAVKEGTEAANVSLVDGKLVITAPEAAVNVTLVATLSCNGVTDTVEFVISSKPVVNMSTIADVLAADAGKNMTSGTVVGLYAQGFLIQDSTATMLVYLSKSWSADVAVGDVVTVEGTTSAYGGAMQFGKDADGNFATYEKTGTATVNRPAAKEMTAADLDEYVAKSATTIEYVSYVGQLVVSGNYYNVNVDGTSKAVGSIQYPATDLSGYNGKWIKVTGYWIGVSSGKYFNTMMINIEEVDAPVGGDSSSSDVVDSSSSDVGGDVVVGSTTISFANTTQRTSLDGSSQVWENNGVKFTNNQAASSNPIADYSNPVRLYQNTEIIIDCVGMTKIEFDVNTNDKKIDGLVNSLAGIAGITVSTNGNIVTVTFAEATNKLTIASVAAQFRLNALTVYTTSNEGGDDNSSSEDSSSDDVVDSSSSEEGGDDVVESTNSVDFNTIVTKETSGGDAKYTNTYTTTNGWTTVNAAIQVGGASVMNPAFPVIGADNTVKAVCLNGKTSAVGKLTSPTLTGGISSLTITYTKMFTDTKLGFTVTLTDLTTGAVYTQTVERDVDKDADKYVVWTFEWTLDTQIAGDFTLVITNTCPSGVDSNKDRVTLLTIVWESAVEGGDPVDPPHEHSFGDWTITVEPTMETEGSAKRVCECGETETEVLPVLGNMMFWSRVPGVAPTCTEEGSMTFMSGYGSVTVVVPATGHNCSEETTDPTCTEAGFTTYTCECGHSYTGNTVPALGHDFANGPCSVCGLIPTIVDTADGTAKTQDFYAFNSGLSSNLGWGDDYTYSINRNQVKPTAAPTASTLWEGYAYVQYRLNGQNVIKVEVLMAPEALNAKGNSKFGPVCCYVSNGGGVLAVNNTEIVKSDNWTKIIYTYVIAEDMREDATSVRVIPSAYDNTEANLATWMQQITYVEISYMENVPEKDPDYSTVQSDECANNKTEAPRSDVYNVTVRWDNVAQTGDDNRIVFADHKKAEAYIEYNMNNMDTIAVTTYEPLNADGTRPENTTQIKFCIWKNGNCVSWETAATKVVVEDGDAVSGRWTKVVWYYTLDKVYASATIRVVLYKPTEGQAEIEMGRVDVYNSEYADFTKLNAQAEIRAYAYAKDFTKYTASNWETVVLTMVEAVKNIDSAPEETAVATIVANAKAAIDAVEVITDVPHEHNFGEWTITVDPTMEMEGSAKRVCECGEAETEVLPVLGNMMIWSRVPGTAPTCTEEGSMTFMSGYGSVTVVVPATGHDYSAAVTEPTCTEVGFTTYTCGTCGDSYKNNEVPALNHAYNVTSTVEPTLNSVGSTTYTCDNCGHSYSDELPALTGAVASINGYKYATLAEALEAAVAGDTVVLMADLTVSEIIVLNKAITLNGESHTITSTAARAINVNCDGIVTIQNVTVNAATGCERGINIISNPSNVIVEYVTINGGYYGINFASSANGANLTVSNSVISSWGAININGDDHDIVVEASTLIGTNNETGETNAFMVIALACTNSSVTVNGGTIKAIANTEQMHWIVGGNTGDYSNTTVVIKADLVLEGENAAYNSVLDFETSSVKFSAVYAEALSNEGFCVEVEDDYVYVAGEHAYKAVVTEPTCTEDGFTTHTCVCGDNYVTDKVAATGHKYVDGVCACGVAEYEVMSIADALKAAQGKKVELSGTVKKIYEAWNTQYNNISVYLTDGVSEIIIYRTKTKIAVGDVIVVKGVIGAYNNVNQIAENSTVVITEKHTCEYTDATCKTPATCVYCEVAKDDVLADHNFQDGLCIICNEADPNYEGEVKVPVTLTLSFATAAARVSQTVSAQVWEANGIKLTNNKAASSTDVGTYTNPARFYAGSEIIVECAGMTKIEFKCNSSSYASTLKTSIGTVSGVTVTVSSSTVTVVFAEETDSFKIAKLSAQVRMDSMTVYALASENDEPPHEHNYAEETTAPTCMKAGFTTYTCECGHSYTGNEVAATGHDMVDGTCSACGYTQSNEGGTTITASKSIADLIVSEGWTNSTTKQSFALDDLVNVKINGGSNSGKAYEGNQIRIYATDSPAGTITISVPEGYELVSIKISTLTGTYAFLCVDGTTTDICNTTTAVSGSSVVIKSVQNGSNGKQARVTNIEVVYKAV